MPKPRLYGPKPEWTIQEWGEQLNALCIAHLLETGHRPNGIRVKWCNWVQVLNAPRLMKAWGFSRKRPTQDVWYVWKPGQVWYHWQGALLPLVPVRSKKKEKKS